MVCGRAQSATGFWSQFCSAGDLTGEFREDANLSSEWEVDEDLDKWSAKIATGEDRRGVCLM